MWKKIYLAETLHDNSASNSIRRSIERIEGIVFYLVKTLHDNNASNSIRRSVARIKGIVLYLLGGVYLLRGFSNIHF